MAIKGLSKPIVADYTANGNQVTYGEPYIADHAVEYSVKINSGDKKELYAELTSPSNSVSGNATRIVLLSLSVFKKESIHKICL